MFATKQSTRPMRPIRFKNKIIGDINENRFSQGKDETRTQI